MPKGYGLTIMQRRVLVALAAATVVGGVFIGLFVTGVLGISGEPPGEASKPALKRTVEAIETVEQATAEAAPRAPKIPLGPTPTPVLSCPDPDAINLKTGIFPNEPGNPLPPLWHGHFNGTARAYGSNGVAYVMVSGDVAGDELQGVIMVMAVEADPCASEAGLATPYATHMYHTPFRTGAVTLTGIDGDTVFFDTVGGTSGRLDYVTGQFEATATPVPAQTGEPVATPVSP